MSKQITTKLRLENTKSTTTKINKINIETKYKIFSFLAKIQLQIILTIKAI